MEWKERYQREKKKEIRKRKRKKKKERNNIFLNETLVHKIIILFLFN